MSCSPHSFLAQHIPPSVNSCTHTTLVRCTAAQLWCLDALFALGATPTALNVHCWRNLLAIRELDCQETIRLFDMTRWNLVRIFHCVQRLIRHTLRRKQTVAINLLAKISISTYNCFAFLHRITWHPLNASMECIPQDIHNRLEYGRPPSGFLPIFSLLIPRITPSVTATRFGSLVCDWDDSEGSSRQCYAHAVAYRCTANWNDLRHSSYSDAKFFMSAVPCSASKGCRNISIYSIYCDAVCTDLETALSLFRRFYAYIFPIGVFLLALVCSVRFIISIKHHLRSSPTCHVV